MPPLRTPHVLMRFPSRALPLVHRLPVKTIGPQSEAPHLKWCPPCPFCPAHRVQLGASRTLSSILQESRCSTSQHQPGPRTCSAWRPSRGQTTSQSYFSGTGRGAARLGTARFTPIVGVRGAFGAWSGAPWTRIQPVSQAAVDSRLLPRHRRSRALVRCQRPSAASEAC